MPVDPKTPSEDVAADSAHTSRPAAASVDAARLKEVFLLAAEASVAERPGLLARLCGGDAPLRREVERLLRVDGESDVPALTELVPRTIDDIANEGVDEADPGPMPERIGRYEVTGLLGMGTGGLVYRAKQTHPDREVAVKLLRVDAPVARRRLERESELMAGLHHPAIAHVYERGVDVATRLPFIAMELVPDALPITRFADERHLPIDGRVSLLLRACEAMQHAHAAGVIHRDLKPANLLVTASGELKIVDFGVGRLLGRTDAARLQDTLGPSLVGTLGYTSPEQLRGIIGTEGDVYSLGAVLYELIAGRPPIDLDDIALIDALARIESSVPTPLRRLNAACGVDLEAVTLKAVDPDPSRRYPTVAQFADDLRRVQAGEAVSARRDGVWRTLGRWTRRHPFVTGVVGTVTVATIAWTAWAGQQHVRRLEVTSRMAAAAVETLNFADTRPGNAPIRKVMTEAFLPATEQLVEARPSDADAKRLLAKLLETQASVRIEAGDPEAATHLRRRALSIFDKLLAANPDAVEVAHQRSIAMVRVGDVLMPVDADQGGEMYREAMRLQQELVDAGATDPSLVDDLGWSYGRMARLAMLRGRPDEAMPWIERQLDIAVKVRAMDPLAPRSYWAEAHACSQWAEAARSLGRFGEFERHMRRGLTAAERLMSLSPDDRTALVFHATHAVRVAAEIEWPAGHAGVAATLADRARESLLRLSRWEPESDETRTLTELLDTLTRTMETSTGVGPGP